MLYSEFNKGVMEGYTAYMLSVAAYSFIAVDMCLGYLKLVSTVSKSVKE